DPFAETLAHGGQFGRSEEEKEDCQNHEPFHGADLAHFVSPQPPGGGRISRSLPTRRVTRTASRCSRSGMAFFRDVPVNSLNRPMSMTGFSGRSRHRRRLWSSIASAWDTLPLCIPTS